MKFTIEWNNDFYDQEWSDETNFEDLKNITQAYGFIFDENNRLCILKASGSKKYSIPGGTPENYDNNFEKTLIREIDEEVDLEIKDIERIGYLKIFRRGSPNEIFHQLRYVAKVNKVNPQTIDPAYGIINERKFIDIKDFEEYTKWGESGKFQLKKALKKLK